MLRELPFGNDGDFSHRAVVGRLNGDLANDLGNLAQRVLVMINRDCGAAVPERGALAAADRDLLDNAGDLLRTTRRHMSDQAVHLALEAIWRVVGEANRYVDEQAPWVLRRRDAARMGAVLYVLAEVIRHLAILLQPFVPASAATLLDQLSVPRDRRDFAVLAEAALMPGTPLPKPEAIFPRFVEAPAA
jgi:methionyl-tRNA synthetase